MAAVPCRFTHSAQKPLPHCVHTPSEGVVRWFVQRRQPATGRPARAGRAGDGADGEDGVPVVTAGRTAA